tara:strand:- start:960 stop:1319 length:360 start_codon:yes stop_codon:yes gene_type:complete
MVGFSSFVSSLFGGGSGSPPNAPSIAKGLIGVPVGVVVAINFAISTIALSDSVIVILLSLIATSVVECNSIITVLKNKANCFRTIYDRFRFNSLKKKFFGILLYIGLIQSTFMGYLSER